MKKHIATLISVALVGLMLSACNSGSDSKVDTSSKPDTSTEAGSNTNTDIGTATAPEPSMTVAEMSEDLLKQAEQPPLVDLTEADIKTLYHLDPALLDSYVVKIPLMNVKTNEIAIVKVKDAKDVQTVEDAIKQRAADVQKTFETYLPDQYDNAKNYKLVTKGNYILFAISDADAVDKLTKQFDTYFAAK
ncbi:hypothetical protein PCCS19_08090 [Paenibacillus sp. CCS19]|uniref:DUF4358 domain-containing protein n=1 Tax=Paenibacillus sp. CCS19 TaxID=3158387 RepID=UPI002569905A|nr:DUF4358 domain-containing protein [Paenibacillus cellulosilyticus]GMK37755.1 hypothetical protein PCCS19_08090 [Paenibacillus cellulosilyticus]